LSDFPAFQSGLNISAAWNTSDAGSNNTMGQRSIAQNMWKRQDANETSADSESFGGQTLADYVDPSLDNQWLYPP